jgi:hypothetical protein
MYTYEQRLARARRRVPRVAPLMDVLALAYKTGDDPERVAHDLWANAVSRQDLRLAMNALILSHVISGQAEWPADVRSALAWAIREGKSPLTPLPGTEA